MAFLRSISLEAVGLGVHLAAGAHDILLQAEILASIPSPVPLPVKDKSKTDVRSNQPKDAQEGIQQVKCQRYWEWYVALCQLLKHVLLLHERTEKKHALCK